MLYHLRWQNFERLINLIRQFDGRFFGGQIKDSDAADALHFLAAGFLASLFYNIRSFLTISATDLHFDELVMFKR